MYDYKLEVEDQRRYAREYRARAESLRSDVEKEIRQLEDMANRADVLADHIERLCTKK